MRARLPPHRADDGLLHGDSLNLEAVQACRTRNEQPPAERLHAASFPPAWSVRQAQRGMTSRQLGDVVSIGMCGVRGCSGGREPPQGRHHPPGLPLGPGRDRHHLHAVPRQCAVRLTATKSYSMSPAAGYHPSRERLAAWLTAMPACKAAAQHLEEAERLCLVRCCRREGGVSKWVSSIAIHNELLRRGRKVCAASQHAATSSVWLGQRTPDTPEQGLAPARAPAWAARA